MRRRCDRRSVRRKHQDPEVMDVEYPEFTRAMCRLLGEMHADGKPIHQAVILHRVTPAERNRFAQYGRDSVVKGGVKGVEAEQLRQGVGLYRQVQVPAANGPDRVEIGPRQDHAPEWPPHEKPWLGAPLRQLSRHLVSDEAGGPGDQDSFQAPFLRSDGLPAMVTTRCGIPSSRGPSMERNSRR